MLYPQNKFCLLYTSDAADGGVEGGALGLVAFAAARVHRRDAVTQHRDVLQTAHRPTTRRRAAPSRPTSADNCTFHVYTSEHYGTLTNERIHTQQQA